MRLETNHLIIREFKVEDAAAVHLYASNPVVAKYMIWGPNTEEETVEFIKRTIEMKNRSPGMTADSLSYSREMEG